MYEARSPVLLIVFNRPEQTRVVFEAVRAARPPRLYVAADAPRSGRRGESERCAETLAVFDMVDWPCEVSLKVNAENLGSHTSIPQAIDWFFSQETEGIVLEDDCVPHIDFFRFCDVLLNRYRDAERVMWINGSNIGYRSDGAAYGFSTYAISWGWASWRRAWQCYDENRFSPQGGGVDSDVIKKAVAGRGLRYLYWRNVMQYCYSIKNWDYRWTYSMWSKGGVACTPYANLISNIGYGIEAVHGGDVSDDRAYIPVVGLPSDIECGSEIAACDALDRYLDAAFYRVGFYMILKLMIASKLPVLRSVIRWIKRRQL